MVYWPLKSTRGSLNTLKGTTHLVLLILVKKGKAIPVTDREGA
jgi:hypothetical protein